MKITATCTIRLALQKFRPTFDFAFLLCLVCLVLSSCTSYKKALLPKQNGIQGYQGTNSETQLLIAQQNKERLAAYDFERSFMNEGAAINWGLSLSGGGLRSASYNMGALKALYDMGVLDSIQLISSVSGGGYLSFWLYTNYYKHASADKEFGHYSFHDNSFIKNVAFQQNRARFLPKTRTLGAFFDLPNRAFGTYRRSIESAYGRDVAHELPITALNSQIAAGKAPYFIINTTVAAQDGQDWLSRIFEFTPLFSGNPELDFQQWDAANNFEWSRAIAISGAAIKFKLLHKIPNYSSKLDAKYIALSDGGHSENLGAIALIRRGVKNIIVVDAGYNKDYSFDGYKVLKQQVEEELGLCLEVEGIDAFIQKQDTLLSHSVFKGHIKNIPIMTETGCVLRDINLYYIKMSLSEDINTLLAPSNAGDLGRELELELQDRCCSSCETYDQCDAYDPNLLTDYETMDLTELSKYWVKSYSEYINNHPVWSRLGYRFPHTTTADQTFYRDQLSAFVGLGYLQASRLEDLLVSSKQ